jgi:FkbM family methyltransferase
MPRLEADRLSMKAVLENCRRIGFRPGTVIDVGFAFGTAGLQETFDDSRHVLIDPMRETIPTMEKFCAEHPGSIWFNAGASDQEGELTLIARQGVTGSSFHTKFKPKDPGNSEKRVVPLITLDKVVSENDLPGPFLLKMDVEGHELHVLKGALEHCLPKAEMVILEIGTWAEDHDKGRPSMMDLFRFMEDHGYVFYEFIDPGYRPIDGALYMFDAVFVKTDSVLRQVRSHKTEAQHAKAQRAKENRVAKEEVQVNRWLHQEAKKAPK